MLNEDICKKREELNKSILMGEDYDVIYSLSIELDELIASFYRGEDKPRRSKVQGNKLIIIN